MFHVKHDNATPVPERAQELIALARAASITLDARQATHMLRYLECVLVENGRVNLTRITAPEDAWRLHLVDSLVVASELEAAPDGPALDLGSGAGFPGVPLALLSGRRFTLLDSVGKKMRAVRAALDCAEVDPALVGVLVGRAEEVGRTRAGAYSAVVARAVAPLPSLVELAAPLLLAGGRLIALKARLETPERRSGAGVADMVGLAESSCRTLELPRYGEIRTVVVYEKVGVSRVRLPRRPGMAQNCPLA